MRFFLRFLSILILAFLAQGFLPWWSAAVVAFGVSVLLSKRPKKRLYGKNPPPARAYLAGFLAIFCLWIGQAWIQNAGNESQLSTDVYQLMFQDLTFWPGPAVVMILLSGVIGGLVGGLSAMTGNLLGEAIKA